ncbi:unnamed protein product [Aureobasidium pullulans]|nr:unnamed protein product [Aureobasidium pullulans]
MAPHAEINPQDITERARRDLLQLLEGVPGKKNLVIEKSLAGPIGLLVKFSTLQEYGVDKVFYVENRNVDDSQRNIVFLARGEKPKDVQLIAEQISQTRQESKTDHEFSVFWVPRRTLSTGLFPRILGKGDNAKKLADLLIRMRSEEEASASSATSKSPSTFGLTPSAVVENVIIIDREVDFFTPLMTQLTYEDTSIVGAAPQQQKPQGAAGAAGGSTQAATKRKIQLDSSDKLYPQLRDCNFAVVGPLLNRTARRLQADYESRHKADQSISDLKTFVAKLPSYQAEQASLKIHTSMAEEIMKTTRSEIFGRVLEVQQNFAAGADPSSMNDNLEELIARDIPLSTILRLLSLESCVAGGIRARDMENLKRQIMYAYGHQHLLTFAALEKMGLVTLRASNTGYLNPMSGINSGNTDYNSIRKTLKLFVDEVDEQDPTDISYVFSGYAPLSVRLVQCVLQKQLLARLSNPRSSSTPNANGGAGNGTPTPQATGWKGFEDVLARIKGATARQTLRGGSGSGRKTTIVFFLGGVTFAEIAALRFMGEQLGDKKKIVIATTGILSGDAAVEAAMEKRAFGRK